MVRITVSIDKKDYEKLSNIIKKEEVSMAWMIRRTVKEFLENHNNDQTIISEIICKNKKEEIL